MSNYVDSSSASARRRPPGSERRDRPRPHAVVIGSGFGGLAAAIRLGARGYRVTILESLDQPGGRARVFRQDGFTFDAGPTIVTAPFLFEELWALCGRRMARRHPADAARSVLPALFRRWRDAGLLRRRRRDARRRRGALARRRRRATRRSCDRREAIYEVGFEQLADVPFSTLRRHAQGPARHGAAAGRPQRLWPGRRAMSGTSGCARR